MKQNSKSLSLLELTTVACVFMLCAAFANEAFSRDLQLLLDSPTGKPVPQAVMIDISLAGARQLARLEGLSGRQALPPHTAKKLVAGAQLPPCFAPESVPPSMMMRLPYLATHEWLILGNDLVLVSLGNNETVFVLSKVFQ